MKLMKVLVLITLIIFWSIFILLFISARFGLSIPTAIVHQAPVTPPVVGAPSGSESVPPDQLQPQFKNSGN